MNHLKIILYLLVFFTNTTLFSQGFTKGFGFIAGTNSDSRTVNIVDINNDGLEDVFISNGVKEGQDDFLYLNNGNKQFSVVHMGDIITDNAASVGATFGDFNNDGHIDAYVTNWYGQQNRLYQNDGTGKLVFQEGKSVNIGSFSETGAWGDYDGDGWLDLYVTNSASSKENYLFRNLQNGNFEQVFIGGPVETTKASRGANWVDINMDGDLDLFVANEDNTANDIFFNNGNGGFIKGINGSVVVLGRSSMSSSWGDIDNDGDFDLFVANAGFNAEQSNHLFLNDGTGKMTRVSLGELVTNGGCSYGSNFGDYDNDGDLDLIVSNGFCNNNLKDWLFENQGDGTFVQKNELLQGLRAVCSYGAAWGDLTNNGFLDLVIANCKNKAEDPEPVNSVFYNKGNENNWLKIKLVGTVSNKSAIGTKVWAKAIIDEQPVWQLRHISGQSGYAGQNSLIVHFGLKNAEKVDSLKIEWPNGETQHLTQIFANQQIEIIEKGVITSLPDQKKEAFELLLFPNPVAISDSNLTIQFKEIPSKSAPIQLSIYNIAGKLILEKKMDGISSDNECNISISTLAKGSYQLVVKQGTAITHNTFIIQ